MWFALRIGAAVLLEGKFDDAAKEMKLALAGAPESQKIYVAGWLRAEAKQDIN